MAVNAAMVAGVIIFGAVGILLVACLIERQRNRKKTRLIHDDMLVIHGARPDSVGLPVSPGGESMSSTARLIVPAGANYDTAATLIRGMPRLSLESVEEDDRASLNGDEHLYADDAPTEEEIREAAEARARADAEEAQQLKEHRLLVSAMLLCSPDMMVRDDSAAAGSECPVCIEVFGEEDPYRRLPCGHMFHAECIDEWLSKNVTCPMCAVSLVETASSLDLKAAKETVDLNRAHAMATHSGPPTRQRPDAVGNRRRLAQV
eukprot:m.97292 g.97292  ORF g.97292 m.97292 type:complete len:262 (+) comp12392_c0_seq2:222-1007(+)